MTDIITLSHGSGGEAMRELLAADIAALYDGDADWDDAALVEGSGRIAVTTDSYVVSPLEFPGGDVGKLAAAGTINDLCMRGARPVFMTVGLIIEEGLPRATLRVMLASLRATCDEAGVRVIAGDTKVVERGSGDGLFINTTGIGVVEASEPPGCERAQPGDCVLVNGPLGDHGIAILAAREQLPMRTDIMSDCAPLHDLVRTLSEACGEGVHVLRDLTRGGLAAALNEIAHASGVGVELEEERVPIRPQVQGACDLLGFDPLHLANEGKLVAFVTAEAADGALNAMRGHPLGRQSAIIGEVISGHGQRVTMRTTLGTLRVLTMPAGELLPRIC